jgi:flagella basal body P-ring formation protein FlgA
MLSSVVFAHQTVCAENTISSKISKAIVSYLLEKEPGYSGKKIEVSYKYTDRVFKELKFRKGNITFVVAELYPDFKPIGNIIVPIQVVVDGTPKEKIFLRTKVSVFDKIVVAKKRLKRGDVIGSFEAAVEDRDIAVLNSSIIKDINQVMGKEAKTFIPKENPIYDWMIKEKPMVKKNEKIKITAKGESIIVEAVGISLEDGQLGSQIKVKNLTSGKEMMATVAGTGEVAVQ